MKSRVDRYLGLVVLVAVTMAVAAAQSTPMQCSAPASSMLLMRASEITARTGDITITCRGGTPTPAGEAVPTVDIQVYLDGTYTGRTAGELTETLLLIDDPPAEAQVPCTTDVSMCGWTGGQKGPNVFQGKLLGPNAVVFQGVPLDPGGDSAGRVFRITNLRVNAAGYPAPDATHSVVVNAYVTATGHDIPNTGLPLPVGYLRTPMKGVLRNDNDYATIYNPNGVEFPNCSTVTKRRVAYLRFTELEYNTLRSANWTYDAVTGVAGTPNAQATPGTNYSTESGFFNPSFPAANNLNKAGLADFGTRLRADFTNLPAGSTIYVSTVPVVYINNVPTPGAIGQDQARLTASATGAFAPVAATETLDGLPAVALPITNGAAQAVWEVEGRNMQAKSNFDFAVWISFPGNAVGIGTASVTMRLAPVSTETSASDTAPLARYADAPSTLPLVTILDMCPSTQYVVTTSPAFLPVVVDGQTYTSPKAFPWTPGSQHTVQVPVAVPTGDGIRQAFWYWSDNKALAHTITVPDSPTTYTAVFYTMYRLDLPVVPPEGGSVQTTPGLVDGYMSPDIDVKLTATINPGFSFGGFSGDAVTAGNELSTWVSMTRPQSVTTTFIRAGAVPSTISVFPASGLAPVAQFRAIYEAPKLASDLKWAQLLVAAAPDGGGQPFCFLHYDVQGKGFWLYSDTDGFFHGPVAASQASSDLQGSGCAADTSYANAYTNGARLTVESLLLFKTAGPRNIYLRTMDQTGVDTGWVQHGTWDQVASPPPPMSVSPANGSGTDQLFTLSYSEFWNSIYYLQPVGWQQFLIAADPSGGGQPFCFVHYDRAGNGLWMYSSDVGFFVGPATPRSASNLLDSSACSVDTALSGPGRPPAQSNSLELMLKLKPPLHGTKYVYMRTLDALRVDSGWQAVGTYQVP